MMMRTLLFTVAFAFVSNASHSHAATVANGPDDICPPTVDPCVVDQIYDVAAPGDLDFGLRTVRVTATGRLQKTMNVSCGAFAAEGGSGKVAIDSKNGGSDAGSVTITARRACSGDGTTPCLDDSLCGGLALGTCSVGAGTVDIDAKIKGNGAPGGTLVIRSAGDIAVGGYVNINSTVAGGLGGLLDIESFTGSVTVTAKVDARAGPPAYYSEPDDSSTVILRASQDVTLAGVLDKGGAQWGGLLIIEAGRDVLVKESINVNAGGLVYASGGDIEIEAGRDLVIAKRDAAGQTRITANGGSDKQGYGTYAEFYGGQGGYLTFVAAADLTIEDQVHIETNAALRQGLSEGYPYGGDIYAIAGGTATVGGTLFSQGSGFISEGRKIRIEGTAGLTLLATAELNVRSNRGGEVRLVSDGPMQLDGRVDTRSNVLDGTNYYAGYYGDGGELLVYGMADVRVGGKLLTGSDGSGEDLVVDVCRLTVEPGGSIDHALRDAQSYADADNNVLIIRESMTVEAGGEIVASGIDGGKNIIRFRDPAKPPLLEGTVDPAPVLITDPSLVGCPVCGNSEIDHTESCDDGNTTSSDGCRDDCQDEGCLAESPGYPSTPLCDDGDACTIDVCDPVGHACGHITSCEEGVACTVDTCVAGACEHTADDLLCDDNDDCTADVCSPAAGCVYANLTGPACEDGDLCTQTGTCRRGACDATDKRPTTKNKIAVRLKPGAADRLSAKAQLSLETFTPDLVLTGIALELRDQDDRTVYAATVAGSEFEVSASGTRYRNATGAPGIDSVRISSVTSKGVAKVRVKAKDVELAGAADQAVMSLSFLFGLDPAVDDCLTARRVPCKSAAAKTTCK